MSQPPVRLLLEGEVGQVTVVPITSPDLDAAEYAWFAALCSDDYRYLGVPDGSLRSSWAHCSDIVREAESQGFGNILCPSSYQVGQDTLSFVAGCAQLDRNDPSGTPR